MAPKSDPKSDAKAAAKKLAAAADEDVEPIVAPELWDDEEEREFILAKAHKDNTREERLQALYQLRNKAINYAELRDDIWADPDIRDAIIEQAKGPDPDAPAKSMYNDGPEIPDEGVRAAALGCIANLALSDTVRLAMALDDALCTVVLMAPPEIAAEEPQSDFVRQRGWLALVGVAIAGACAKKKERNKGGTDVGDGLILGLKDTLPPSVRAGVFQTLWSMAMTPEVDRKSLFRYRQLREAVVASALPGMPGEVREQAMGLLWALAAYGPLQEQMWKDEPTRDAIIKGACETWDPVWPNTEEEEDGEEKEEDVPLVFKDSDDEAEKDDDQEDEDEEEEEEGIGKQPTPTEVRIRALKALACLACEAENRADMWAHQELGVIMLQALDKDQPHNVRSAAFSAVQQLNLCYDNQLPMFGADVHTLLLDATRDEKFTDKERRGFTFGFDRIKAGAELAQYWLDLEAKEAREAAAAAEAAAKAAMAAEAAAVCAPAPDEEATRKPSKDKRNRSKLLAAGAGSRHGSRRPSKEKA